MLANYHMHTYRCNHANGTEREYIERAIAGGLKIIGFSDHAPFIFPDGYESGYRVPMTLSREYISTLKELREEYKDKIQIHIGFEMEYFPKFFDEMLSYVKEIGTEYIILGQHYIGKEVDENGRLYRNHVTAPDKTEAQLTEYADYVTTAVKSGVFSYVAHPDMFNYDDKAPEYDREMRRICKTAAEYNIPLEINCLGIRDNRIYPNESFWKIAGEEGCSAIIGFDSHDVPSAFDGDSIPKAEKLAADYGLEIVERLDIKKL